MSQYRKHCSLHKAGRCAKELMHTDRELTSSKQQLSSKCQPHHDIFPFATLLAVCIMSVCVFPFILTVYSSWYVLIHAYNNYVVPRCNMRIIVQRVYVCVGVGGCVDVEVGVGVGAGAGAHVSVCMCVFLFRFLVYSSWYVLIRAHVCDEYCTSNVWYVDFC